MNLKNLPNFCYKYYKIRKTDEQKSGKLLVCKYCHYKASQMEYMI